jgi:hypothetical protein
MQLLRVKTAVTMKIFKLIGILSLALLASGCLTSKVLDSAGSSQVKVFRDEIHRVDRAFVTADRDLAVLIEATLTNSNKRTECTLTIPVGRYVDFSRSTRERFSLPRSVLSAGWDVPGLERRKARAITVGPEVRLLQNQELNLTAFRPPGAEDAAVYSVHRATPNPGWELIYSYAAKPTEPVKLNRFALQPFTSTSRSSIGYFLLPLTVPLDIAFGPIELLFHRGIRN